MFLSAPRAPLFRTLSRAAVVVRLRRFFFVESRLRLRLIFGGAFFGMIVVFLMMI